MFDFLVLLGAVGSQFFLVPKWVNGDEVYVFYWLILVVVSSFMFVQKRRTATGPMAFVLLASIFSVLSNLGADQQPIYVAMFFKVLLGCLAIKIISERIEMFESGIARIFIWMWIVVYGVLISQLLGFTWRGYELSGFYTMPWMMGCAACLSIPFLKRTTSWYSIILIPPIVLSHSTAIVAISLFMWIRPKLKDILLVIIFVVIYMVICDPTIDSARFHVIKNTIPHWHNMVFGDGIGSWAHKAFVRYNGEQLYYWRWAHNEWYQMATETGLFGLVALIVAVGRLFVGIAKERWYYLIGIILLSMFHPIMHIPRLIPLVILILAINARRCHFENSGYRKKV